MNRPRRAKHEEKASGVREHPDSSCVENNLNFNEIISIPIYCDFEVALFAIREAFAGLSSSLKGRFRCACEVVVSARCESSSRNVWFLVAEGHCVAAKRGGEQPEANVRSVG